MGSAAGATNEGPTFAASGRVGPVEKQKWNPEAGANQKRRPQGDDPSPDRHEIGVQTDFTSV